MRSSTSCPHGKVCGAGSEYETGSITPVLKVRLDEAMFGLEPVTFAQIMEAFLDSSAHPCSACRTLQRPVSSQLVTTNTLQIAPQVLILIFSPEQVSFADYINCDDLSKLLSLHTLFSGTKLLTFDVHCLHTPASALNCRRSVLMCSLRSKECQADQRWQWCCKKTSFCATASTAPTSSTTWCAHLCSMMVLAPRAGTSRWQSESRRMANTTRVTSGATLTVLDLYSF